MFKLLWQANKGDDWTVVFIGSRDEIYDWIESNSNGYNSKIVRT